MPNRTPFFIVACARSGTTLVRAMLDRHPEVAIAPESHFIPELWKRRRRYGPQGRVERPDVFLRDLVSHPRFRYWNVPRELLREDLRRLGPGASFADAVTAPHRAYAEWKGKPRWGDKTPDYVGTLPLLASLFPDARFVHILRDGRDVALSMMDLGRLHRGPASPALFWARRVRRGRADGSALGPERYTELRYEDLIDDPDGVMRSLCRFLDLAFDPAIVEHRAGASAMVPEALRWMHRNLDRPPTKGLRDWRTEMSPRDAARFQAVAGSTLAGFGYPPGPRPGPGDRLAAWGQVAGFGGRIVARRLHQAVRRGGTRPQAPLPTRAAGPGRPA